MQFNLNNAQKQVAQFVQRGMALTLGLLVLRGGGGGACSVSSVGVY